MDGKYGAVSFVSILASEMSDRMLADFLSIEHPVTISLHLKSIDQNKAIKIAKRAITDIDKMKMDEQKKAFKAGYDSDIIPPDILTYSEEAKSLLNDLQSREFVINENSTVVYLKCLPFGFEVSHRVERYAKINKFDIFVESFEIVA